MVSENFSITDNRPLTTDHFQAILAPFDYHNRKLSFRADHFLRHKLRRADKDAQRFGGRAEAAATRRSLALRLRRSHATSNPTHRPAHQPIASHLHHASARRSSLRLDGSLSHLRHGRTCATN